jgi:hypothetical protein
MTVHLDEHHCIIKALGRDNQLVNGGTTFVISLSWDVAWHVMVGYCGCNSVPSPPLPPIDNSDLLSSGTLKPGLTPGNYEIMSPAVWSQLIECFRGRPEIVG